MEESIERILDQLDLIINEVQEIKSRMLRMLHSNFDHENNGIGINHADNDNGSLSSDNGSENSFDGDGSDPHNIGPNGDDIPESSDSEDVGSENDGGESYSLYFTTGDNSYDPEEQSDSCSDSC